MCLLKVNKAILLSFLLCLVFKTGEAQVSGYYTWSQSDQTYKSDTSTTTTVPASIFSTGWDDVAYTGYQFPFNFTYNGVLYTAGVGTIGVDTDGWIAFSTGSITMTGTGAGGSWVSISDHTGVYLNGTANNNGFCGFNSDVRDQTFTNITGNLVTGSRTVTNVSAFNELAVGTRLTGTGITNGTVITSLNLAASSFTMSSPATATATAVTITPRTSIYAFIRGVAPYRQFVVQWTKVERYASTGGDDFSFQLVLNEGGGLPNYQTLQAVYGICKATSATPQNAQVGLRGATAADFNARKTTTNWAGTIAAVANTETCSLTNAVFPNEGLTFTWSPACLGNPSNAGAISGPTAVCPGSTYDYTIPGVPGAIFYTWTYTGTNTTYSTTTTLPLNTVGFGVTATGGTLTVTPGNLCGTGASSSIVISMSGLPSATIAYGASSYCTSSAPSTPTITGTTGGTFSASPAGLTINASTGQLTPATSTAGNYVVTYTFTSGCTATTTANITINAGPAVTATATPTSVCTAPNSTQLLASVPVSNYNLSSIPYTSVAPSGGPTVIWNSYQLDNISTAIAMPFAFNFYGSPITQFYVSTEGYVQLQTGTAVEWVPQTLPNATVPNNIIALAWADLIVDPSTNPGSSVRYFVNGVTPNRVLVIDFINLRFLGGGSLSQNVTGQIRLYENDSHIEIAAGTVNNSSSPWQKTMGIENSTGTLATTPPGRNNTVWNTTNEAWSFTPASNTFTYSWSPGTFLSSTSIANPVANNVSSTTAYTVTVTNTSTGCSGTANATVSLLTPMSGTYTVGAGGNFTTLTAAVAAYNLGCIGGPILFSLIDNTYPGETFPIIINSNASQSSTNTLTIKPAAGKTPLITGNSTAAIIKLNGADYVTIDGSNAAGGTTRDLTLINTSNNTTTSTIVWLASVNASNGATNNTVKNCVFTGNSTTSTFTQLLSSGVVAGANAEAANNNNTFTNNTFTKALTAIAVVGPLTSETGVTITNNTIGSSVAASKLGWSGIELYYQSNAQVNYNAISGITTSNFTLTTSGISVFGTASNITISHNNIGDIKHTNTGGYGANGIWLASTSTAANINVFNNMVYDIAGWGFSGGRDYDDNGYGIILDGGGGYNLYYNTVHLTTQQPIAGRPACLNVTSFMTTPGSVNVKNNIFQNSQTNGTHYAIQCSASNAVFATLNYNAYYSAPGGTTALGYIGSDRAALADIQAGFGQNANSIQPASAALFVSGTNMHMNPSWPNNISNWKNRGNPIAGYTEDYDNTTRNGYTPDLGADEWVDPNYGSWVGKTNTDWLVPTNWEANFIPDNTTDVIINGGYIFMPTIITTQAVRGLALSAPVPANTPILTLNGGTLQVFGVITRTGGNIEGSNGTLEMSSTTAAQTIPASLFVNNNLKNLIISNTNNVSGVTLGGALDIYRSVTFSAAGMRLTTGNFLTFKSTATETAWLGNVTGKTITGNATVERYIPTGLGSLPSHGKSWQFLGVPLNSTQTVKAAWQEGALLPNANPVPGFGTQLTSNLAGALALGFDVYTPSGGPSMKTFDPGAAPGAGTWVGIANTSPLSISNQKGYMVFIRGNRNDTTYNGTINPTVLRATGQLYTPTGTLPPVTTVLNGRFASIGNPYASAIDFLNVNKTAAPAIDDAYYVWDPLLAGSYGLGAYQLISAANGWKPSPGGTNNYNAAVAYTKIQSGQAFFVHATGAGGTVSFTEAAKVSGSQLTYRPSTLQAQGMADRQFLRVGLYAVNPSGTFIADGNVVAFDPGFINEYSADDALKIGNSSEDLGILSGGRILSLEARAPVTETDTVFYSVKNLRKMPYQLKFAPENMGASRYIPYLLDRYNGSKTALSLTDTTVIDFVVNEEPASSAANRFLVIFRQANVVPVTFVQISANRNSDKSIRVDWKVENELSIARYELQRSANGRDFSPVYSTTAKDNNGGPAAYGFTDARPLATDNFYRVKAGNLSGQVQFSAIVQVRPVKSEPAISIYPNPAETGRIQVHFSNMPAGTLRFQLSNIAGQVVFTGKCNLPEGNSVQTIYPGKALAAGSYQLKLISESGMEKIIQLQVE
jgi:hypothetical protein